MKTISLAINSSRPLRFSKPQRSSEQINIFVDGAVGDPHHAGIAAVALSPEGFFQGWLSRQLPGMTNNEAEYHAVLLGLELARQLNSGRVAITSDSEVVVRQMLGLSRVHSGRLKQLHQRTCTAVAYFQGVHFRHVRREQNKLADALAAEAMAGRVVRMP